MLAHDMNEFGSNKVIDSTLGVHSNLIPILKDKNYHNFSYEKCVGDSGSDIHIETFTNLLAFILISSLSLFLIIFLV